MHQQYPNAYLQNSVPVRVVYLARQGLWLSLTGFFSDCNFSWLQFVTDSFFYLCTNQTWHASDSSALCRVFSASRKVCGYPCGWFFLFIFTFVSFMLFR